MTRGADLTPYVLVLVAGMVLGGAIMAAHPIVQALIGAGFAAAYAFAPPLPGAREERERLGARRAQVAAAACFVAGAAGAAAIKLALDLDGERTAPTWLAATIGACFGGLAVAFILARRR